MKKKSYTVSLCQIENLYIDSHSQAVCIFSIQCTGGTNEACLIRLLGFFVTRLK